MTVVVIDAGNPSSPSGLDSVNLSATKPGPFCGVAVQTMVFHPRSPPCSVLVPLFAGSVYVTPLFEQPVHCIVNEWLAIRFA